MRRAVDMNRQFYSVAELLDQGLSYYLINKMVADGILIRLNRKMYENPAYHGDSSDFSYVTSCIPKGIVCMMSAARFYGLTAFLPDSVDVAIGRDMKVSSMPQWPPMKIWYFPQKRFSSGIVEANDGTVDFKIYDMEKTVADIVYYRNKVGIEETREVLVNYLSRRDRDLDRLRFYSDMLGSKKILETYLEVLV